MIRHIWTMPEKRDEDFSLELIEKFEFLAKSLGISAFSIEIREQYQDEEIPHYHMKVESDLCVDLLVEIGANASYSATANEQTYEGLMKVRVCINGPKSIGLILTAALFGHYDECIREYYKEWKTEYKEIQFPV